MFGDIGTSPLYTLSSVFTDVYGTATVTINHPRAAAPRPRRRFRSPERGPASQVPRPDDIRGALCCIIWLLTSVVTVKYGLIMLTGNHHGEGGTFALLNTLKASGKLQNRPRLWFGYQLMAALAASFLVADGLLTPVITVTSAVEGIGLSIQRFDTSSGTVALDTGQPGSSVNFGHTCTLSAAVLVCVFSIQTFGRCVPQCPEHGAQPAQEHLASPLRPPRVQPAGRRALWPDRADVDAIHRHHGCHLHPQKRRRQRV